jgi:8-oxo-dGTP diphosphatase
MIEVTAGLILHEGKVLIARRKAGKHLAGFWEFPGGKIEPGEAPEASLQRELEEELGVRVKVGEAFMVNDHIYPEKTVRLHSFLVHHLSGEFTLHDHSAIEWVKPSELFDFLLAPADVPIAERLVAAKKLF